MELDVLIMLHIAKDKANEKVTAIRNSDTWKNTKKQLVMLLMM